MASAVAKVGAAYSSFRTGFGKLELLDLIGAAEALAGRGEDAEDDDNEAEEAEGDDPDTLEEVEEDTEARRRSMDLDAIV